MVLKIQLQNDCVIIFGVRKKTIMNINQRIDLKSNKKITDFNR
jgi:hypothetical protein